MTRIAFLGLGQMGAPMAARLLDAGHELTVWNRSADKTAALGDRGAKVAANPGQAATGGEVVITMLSDPDAVEQVILGEEGIATTLAVGQVVVEMSTVGPDAVRSTARRLPEGVELVDAPVRGSVPQATAGSLIVLVGGSDEAVARVRPILQILGSVHHVGGPGSGAAMKLVANSTIGATISALGEALALGDSLGLDRSALMDMLAETPIGVVVKGKRGNVEAGEYPPNFKLALARKDLALVADAASRAGLALRVNGASLAWFEEAERHGAGDRDYSAVVETIAPRRAG